MPAVNVIVSRSSSGSEIQDNLSESEVGLNHGDVPTNSNTLEEILYISHDSLNTITDIKIYIDNLAELLVWGDANNSDGLLIDTDNNGIYDLNFKTGQGDALVNGINIGNVNSGQEKVIRLKINIPGSEDTEGIRKFNLNFTYDYTP